MKSDEELLGAMFDARLKKIERLEDEVRELRVLVTRAHALVARASHIVDDSYPNWHRNAESFLGDCMGHLDH